MRRVRTPTLRSWFLGMFLFAVCAKIGVSVIGPPPFQILCVIEPMLLIVCAMTMSSFIRRGVALTLFLLIGYAGIHAAAMFVLLELAPREDAHLALVALVILPCCVFANVGNLLGCDPEEILSWHAFAGMTGALLYALVGFLFARTCVAVDRLPRLSVQPPSPFRR
jgi:hypothetical protein